MKRKLTCLLLAMVLGMYMSVPARAARAVGSVTVNLPGAQGEIAMFYLGAWCQEGFRLEDTYGGGLIREEDVHSQALAWWLAESDAGEGRYLEIGETGSVTYGAVPDGLYLVKHIGRQRKMEPFLLTMPYDGTWDLQVNPLADVLPPTGQGAELWLALAGMLGSGLGLGVCVWKRRDSGQ